ncbi:hypothetical protein AURDEDRAFT_172527 [Auricularia subglabra TFB-10046 SS5]|nr:hypothetical protein AURDEDRAFT_172527 [Auricularia subglabra TFB-10046 SS5]
MPFVSPPLASAANYRRRCQEATPPHAGTSGRQPTYILNGLKGEYRGLEILSFALHTVSPPPSCVSLSPRVTASPHVVHTIATADAISDLRTAYLRIGSHTDQ